MTTLCALLDSGRYREEVQRHGPALARLELWREADRRAKRIVDRLVPQINFSAGFRFEHGKEAFIARSRGRAAHEAKRMIVLDYARDQILAKLQRRLQVGAIIGDML